MAEHEHAGHRKRLLAKLEKGALENHEYLEALLFNAIPRMNTNDIAHRLLSRFGSIQGVLEASVQELKSVKGIGENAAQYLCLIGKIFQSVSKEQENRVFPKKFEEDEFVEFLKTYYKDADKEYLDCFLLDEHARIKQTVRFTTGDTYSVDIATNELDKVLSINQPAAILLSHNHIKGNSTPSIEDEKTTCALQIMCHMQNIRFCDHFIVSPVEVFSYHASGRLKKISSDFAIRKIIAEKIDIKKPLSEKFY